MLNAFWFFLFFGLRSPLYGLIDILFLDIAVAMTMIYAYRVSKYAAVLLCSIHGLDSICYDFKFGDFYIKLSFFLMLHVINTCVSTPMIWIFQKIQC